jgi:transcriptional regulator of acetoin/glycerol metabolism
MQLLLTDDLGKFDEIDVTTAASPVVPLLEMSLTKAKRRAAADFERRYLVLVMEQARGSVSEGARRSGLDRTNFRRLLQRHGLR